MERYEGEEKRFFGTAELQDKVETNSSNVNSFGRTHKMQQPISRVTTDHVYVKVNYISLQPATHFQDIQ